MRAREKRERQRERQTDRQTDRQRTGRRRSAERQISCQGLIADITQNGEAKFAYCTYVA